MKSGKELKRHEGEQSLSPFAFTGSPHFEMLERDGNVVVRGELPGLEEKDVNVVVEDGALTITGEKRASSEEERAGFFHSQSSYSSFTRRIPLASDVDVSSMAKRFDDGVLEVTLAKRH
jgi:HSP20 family protein